MASQPHEVVEYLQDTEAVVPRASGDAVRFEWDGGNKTGVFDDLAEMGWRVSSVSNIAGATFVYVDSADTRPRQES